MKVRPTAVAGYFYPEERQELRETLDRLLAENPSQGSRPKALVVPHAGYSYSGPVAARAYNRLKPYADQIHRVVLLGPSHRVPLRGMALPDTDAFATPLGLIDLDVERMAEIAGMPGVQILPEAHAFEHSLEVQLPFLQRVLKAFHLVPIVVGQCPWEQVAAVIAALWGDERTLILISSDLSHYHPYEEAQRVDRRTSDKILACDPSLQGEQACGCQPLNGLLGLLQQRGLGVELLDLRNSGDTAGDKSRVVGYGAYAVGSA